MSFVVNLDWKFVVALGAAACGIILCVKMDADSAEKVSIHSIDACKEIAETRTGIR